MRPRGRAGSFDVQSIEQEFEDVAAVVEAIAAGAASVALCGHSYGAGCAMGAAALADKGSHVILYEPGLGIVGSPSRADPLSALCIPPREEGHCGKQSLRQHRERT